MAAGRRACPTCSARIVAVERDEPELRELRGLQRDGARGRSTATRRRARCPMSGAPRSTSGAPPPPRSGNPSAFQHRGGSRASTHGGDHADRRVEHLALEVPEAVPVVALRGRHRPGRQDHHEARSRSGTSRERRAGAEVDPREPRPRPRAGAAIARERDAARDGAGAVLARAASRLRGWPPDRRSAIEPHPRGDRAGGGARTGRRVLGSRGTDPSSRTRARAGPRPPAGASSNAVAVASSIEPARRRTARDRRTRAATSSAASPIATTPARRSASRARAARGPDPSRGRRRSGRRRGRRRSRRAPHARWSPSSRRRTGRPSTSATTSPRCGCRSERRRARRGPRRPRRRTRGRPRRRRRRRRRYPPDPHRPTRAAPRPVRSATRARRRRYPTSPAAGWPDAEPDDRHRALATRCRPRRGRRALPTWTSSAVVCRAKIRAFASTYASNDPCQSR